MDEAFRQAVNSVFEFGELFSAKLIFTQFQLAEEKKRAKIFLFHQRIDLVLHASISMWSATPSSS
jgi:hypothetical protein